METLLKLVALWVLLSGSLLLAYAWRELLASWREPVFKRPVAIIESDDWGPGPAVQADVLAGIAKILEGFSDRDGHHPVMTLGMVLAAPDGTRIGETGEYHSRPLEHPDYRALLQSIRDGQDKKTFDVHLHGMEHYWPPAVMAASRTDESVREWLERSPDAMTEELPPHLQSRWVDASGLPARDLDNADIRRAVEEEMARFAAVFGQPATVIVPPTFVWNTEVERAWAGAGACVIVTSGRRYESRDSKGEPEASGGYIRNGQTGVNGLVYIVRDVYFEPALGHTAADAIRALAHKVRLGRPALFETHRFNFLGDERTVRRSLEQLGAMLREALDAYPSLAFMPTRRLAGLLKDRDPAWIEQRPRRRLHVLLERLGEHGRLRKMAWLTGWIWPVMLVWKLTG